MPGIHLYQLFWALLIATTVVSTSLPRTRRQHNTGTAAAAEEVEFDTYFQQGLSSYSSEDYAASASYLEKAGALNPNNATLLDLLGQVQTRQRLFNKAGRVFNRMLEFDQLGANARLSELGALIVQYPTSYNSVLASPLASPDATESTTISLPYYYCFRSGNPTLSSSLCESDSNIIPQVVRLSVFHNPVSSPCPFSEAYDWVKMSCPRQPRLSSSFSPSEAASFSWSETLQNVCRTNMGFSPSECRSRLPSLLRSLRRELLSLSSSSPRTTAGGLHSPRSSGALESGLYLSSLVALDDVAAAHEDFQEGNLWRGHGWSKRGPPGGGGRADDADVLYGAATLLEGGGERDKLQLQEAIARFHDLRTRANKRRCYLSTVAAFLPREGGKVLEIG